MAEFVIMSIRPFSFFAFALFLGLILSPYGYFAFCADLSVKKPAPHLATLQGRHMPLKTALVELDRQTSNVVADQMGEPDPILDLDLKGVAFWQALDAIADKAGARVDLHPREARSLLLNGLRIGTFLSSVTAAPSVQH